MPKCIIFERIMALPLQNKLSGEEKVLLSNFNDRLVEDFGKVYSLFYNELFYFAAKLYRNTEVEPRDAIQDVFLGLWQSKSRRFESLTSIKAYLFVALRNNFRSFILHHKYVEKYESSQLLTKELFEANVVESEVLSTFHYIIGLLPEESAEILELFLEGWSAEEIACKLGKNKQTIYNKKSEAIAWLKSRLSKDILFLFLSLIH
ncbi:MAG: sigma-70 family RNA polymerase sigma factor [Oscillibacter sp.]|nr:sigma-70 family RNA polymerase sigma factor [Oscillibacter sp.]